MTKRLLLCLSVALFLLCFFFMSEAAGVGDINGDGSVSAADARMALRYAVSLETPDARQRLAADADHDGTLSAADARLILRVVVELEVFTHPFDRADHTVSVAKAPTCAEEGVLRTICVCGAVREEPLPRTDAHVFPDVWTEKTPAGCETGGVNEKRCTVCNTAVTETVPPLGHAYEERETKASCETEGLLQSVCVRCGKVAAEKALSPPGHTLRETVTKAPTCTADGKKRLQCENCDYSALAILPALGHDFAEAYAEVRAASCTEPGISARRCSRCTAVADSVPIPAPGHNFTVSVTPATCTGPGTERSVCARCGVVGETKELPPAGHDYRVASEEISDCTRGGSRRLVCSVCGETSVEEVPAAPHSFAAEPVDVIGATCLTAGRQTLRCSVCGKTQTEEIPATGHQKIRAPEADVAPTCTASGTEGYVCARCGADLSVRIAANGHTPQVNAGIPPTCTADGRSDETVCSVCAAVLTAGVPLQATGHSYSAWETDAATGILSRYCLICGETETRTSPCVHQYTETSKTPPGCETGGELIETCGVCGDKKRTILPPAGHDYEAQIFAPTCTEAGYTIHTCTRCGRCYSDAETPAPGHAGTLRGQRDASCAQAGYSGDLICSRCEKTLQTGTVLPALPHTPAEDYSQEKAPTCTADGRETLICTVCKTVLAERILPAAGHTPTYLYENNGTVRKTVCGRCGALMETAARSAVMISKTGERTDVFDLEQTLPAAAAGSTVVLAGDYTLRGSVSVPAGVCFVVPCFAGDQGYTGAGGIPDGTAAVNGNTKSRYCALTVPSGCTLTVEGTLLVNAQTGRLLSGPCANQDVSGGYGEILLSGQIVVKNGGCFDCAGYVNAAAPANGGTVTLEPGAAMYETAQILRFRGATNAVYSASLGVYPIFEQSMLSVRARLVVSSGATVYGRTKLYAAASNENAALCPAVFPLIGESGLFRLADGGTVERLISGSTEDTLRSVYRFCGGAAIQSTAFAPLPGAVLQTGDFLYPVNGDCSLVFEKGDYTLLCDLLLLPGAAVTVEKDAVFSVPAGKKLVLANNGFYEKDAQTGACAYPAGRQPAVLDIAEGGVVSAAGTLAGQVNAAGTLSAHGAARTAVILVPTELLVSAAHQKEYEVTVS